MTYNRALWLPEVLRAAGLPVVEHDGWKTRGLGSHRPFDPDSVVWHHDASAPGDSPGVPGYMIRNFERAGAQIWVDRGGRWHLVASGRAAHAGKTRRGMPTNESSLGIETDHTTGEEWPDALLDSLRLGTAAILRHLRTDPYAGLHFHKTICDPPGRKVDPDGLDLDEERANVAALMTTAKDEDVKLTDEIPGVKDRDGKPVTVAQALARGAWAYDQIRNGGATERRVRRGAYAYAQVINGGSIDRRLRRLEP